uniref:Uncharacterized protein n=1 Tax=Anguilla anguilla TaxID=7936 RepID=A0A0E9U310_ANGAN
MKRAHKKDSAGVSHELFLAR